MICKAFAEGASAFLFYFYKEGKKGELFSLVKSSPSASLCSLSQLRFGRCWANVRWTFSTPKTLLAFEKARQNFEGKTSFFRWWYGFSGEGERSWTLTKATIIWKGLSETLRRKSWALHRPTSFLKKAWPKTLFFANGSFFTNGKQKVKALIM